MQLFIIVTTMWVLVIIVLGLDLLFGSRKR